MSIKIEKKIVSYALASKEEESKAVAAPVETKAAEQILHMHEQVKRPESLVGSTYKIKTPLSEHALYVTINDMVLNEGTSHEVRRPFEMFINSKNMDHYQWIVALTLIISAVFRKGGDVSFLVEELHSVFDPRGGYFKKGGKFCPSLVSEIGDVIETHLKRIGLIEDEGLDEHQKKLIAEKRAQYESKLSQSNAVEPADNGQFPEGAKLCTKCNTKAMIIMDNCLTCLNCGDSKCG